MKKIYLLIIETIFLIFISSQVVYAEIKINPDTINIGIDYSQNLKVTGDTSDNIVWKTSNSSIVTVNNGKILGKGIGTAYISVTNGRDTAICKVNVIEKYIPINTITLDKKSDTLILGETKKINVTILPNTASNKNLIYTSSNSNVATVDQNGNVTAKKVGTAIISVSAEGKSALYNITVTDNIPLKQISINQSLELKERETKKLTITYNPTNATNKKVTWKSSNTNIVTVDSNGNLKAVSPGSATITVISNDGGHVATSKITVIALDKKVKGIKLNKEELSLEMGKEETLTVTFDPEYAENKKITWTSSNKLVATVENGKIKTIKPGKVEIKAESEDGNFTAICKLTVLSLPIESIKFEKEEQTVYLNSETTLNTISTPKDTQINDPIWTSSNEEIATVKNGVVTAKKIGETTITISSPDGKITASTIIKVVEKPAEPLMISIENYNLNFNKNVKEYTITIGKEESLNIKTNIDSSKVTINGNKNLKNGSIITITIKDKSKTTYVINIQKRENYAIYFIAIISVLLLLNIIRILLKNRKNKR